MSIAPRVLITIGLSVLALYAIYSVHRYFGLKRAFGADHFEGRYRKILLVKKGVLRFTNNGMYVYAFLSFWAIAMVLTPAPLLSLPSLAMPIYGFTILLLRIPIWIIFITRGFKTEHRT